MYVRYYLSISKEHQMAKQHTVTLLHASPLHLASHGARTCWDSHDKSDDGGPKDCELIARVGNKFRHASILEHINYTFYIEGISRACLQELSRHRHTSPSVKSSRYTLGELKNESTFRDNDSETYEQTYMRASKYVVFTHNSDVDYAIIKGLELLRQVVLSGVSNDISKYVLIEAYKVTEQLTINARSLQNLLSLRSDKPALWEIRQLATSLYEAIPTDHQYLFTHCMKESHDSLI